MSDHLIQQVTDCVSKQGTQYFMSIEVAARRYLFLPSAPGISFDQLGEQLLARQQGVRAAQTKVPFFHNHLHDLESLWWVAVWVVFFNDFSNRTPSPDHTSLTLQDARDQLKLARDLFPSMLGSFIRRDGFQNSTSFQKACNELPPNKADFCNRLDVLRELLIGHYRVI